MMVSGFTWAASTIRNRNCPSDQRAPAPFRSGARLPWNRSSGNGPLWHSRQSPTWRLTTMARPRAGSPPAPVSEAGMASPTTVYGRSASCAEAAAKLRDVMNQKVTLSLLTAPRKSSAIALGRRYMLGFEISQLACLLLPLKRGGRRARPRVGRGGWGSNGRPEKRSPPGAQERADLPFSRLRDSRISSSSLLAGLHQLTLDDSAGTEKLSDDLQ